MRQHMVMAVATAAVVVFLVGNAPGQEISATIRTYQGVSYKVADPSLEVFYTIGEPAEKAEAAKFPSTISITTGPTAGVSGGEQPSAAPLLRGHSRAGDITVWRQGVETRIAVDQIRAMRFSRNPVIVAGLQFPPYIPYYKYSVSVSLMSGGQVDADYVNLGGTIVRGTAPNGRLDIPWGEVESIIFER